MSYSATTFPLYISYDLFFFPSFLFPSCPFVLALSFPVLNLVFLSYINNHYWRLLIAPLRIWLHVTVMLIPLRSFARHHTMTIMQMYLRPLSRYASNVFVGTITCSPSWYCSYYIMFMISQIHIPEKKKKEKLIPSPVPFLALLPPFCVSI